MPTYSFPFGMLAIAILSGVGYLTGASPSCAAESQDGDSKADSRAVDKAEYPPRYISEAPLPAGFPPPGELGQVVEKTYPACRTYSAQGNQAFMHCFAYLAKNKHEMTAPVIVDYKSKSNAPEEPAADIGFVDVARMHFILDDASLDQPKQDGPVTVADMARMRVLSIACQGEMSAAKLDEAERKLEAEIARRQATVAAGPKRVLGYNSPMVPKGKTYWEVQVPIKEQLQGIAQ